MARPISCFDKNGNRLKFNKTCYHCKTNIEIFRNKENNEVVYYNKNYYHKECFKKTDSCKIKEFRKKCGFTLLSPTVDDPKNKLRCNEEIIIDNKSDVGDIVFYKNKFYHLDCFTKMCQSDIQEYNSRNKKSKKPQLMIAFDYIDVYLSEAKLKVEEHFEIQENRTLKIDNLIEDTQFVIKNMFIESDIDSYIKKRYDIEVLPDNLYKSCLEKIYNGSYKNLKGTKIPPEDFLDMWKRKESFLDKVYFKNVSKGMNMTSEQRIKYDISVLINKYNSYLKWKEEQKILEVKSEIKEKDNLVNKIVIGKEINKCGKIEEQNDMSSLVDDIWGD